MTNCPHCRDHRPHRASTIHCSKCGRVFAKYHVPPEENGVRLCKDCRAQIADSTLISAFCGLIPYPSHITPPVLALMSR